MRRTCFIFSLLTGLFLTSLVFAGDNPPATSSQKEQEPYTWDFGQIKAGDITRHDFVLKNVGKTAMNIKEVSTTCGCTTSKLQKSTLEPKESTIVEISFNSKGYGGGVQKYIYVKTDNNDAAASLSVDGKIGKPALPEVPPGAPAPTVDNSAIKLTIKGEVIKEEVGG